MDSFKLSEDKSQTVSLGCGTLILIALIVIIFSREGTKDLERDVDGMRKEVKDLKTAVDAQSRQLDAIQQSISKLGPPKAKD